MQKEGLLVRSLEAVDVLLVLAGAERRHRQRLRLAAGEQRRAVRARQDAGFGHDRAHRLEVAAVDARAGVEDVPAHDLRLRVLEHRLDLLGVELRRAVGRAQLGHHLGLDGIDGAVTLLLDGLLVGLAQVGFGDLEDGRLDLGQVGRLVVARLLGGLLGEADDGLDDRLEMLVAEHDGAEHDVLGQLLGLRLDHQHRVGRAGDDEVEGRLLHFLKRRVELVLTADIADPGGADRAHEGHAGKGQGSGGRHDADDVGIVLEVVRQHRHDDLRVVLVAFREQGADGAVDEAGGERLLLGRPALALEIAAGDAAGRVGALLVIDREREEVEAGLRLLLGNDGGENGGLAVGGDDGAVGLAGHLARFEHELAPGPDQLFTLDIEHFGGLSCMRAAARCHEQDGERLPLPGRERPSRAEGAIGCGGGANISGESGAATLTRSLRDPPSPIEGKVGAPCDPAMDIVSSAG